MYVLNNGHSYIGVNSDNVQTSVSNIKKALHFSDGKKASNYKDNLKTTLKKFNWQIVKVDDDTINNDTEIENTGEYIYVETPLEKSGFDISKFFNYECKSNRIIAQYFLNDLARLEDVQSMEVIKNIKESEYQPRVLTYELLDEIVGKRGNM